MCKARLSMKHWKIYRHQSEAQKRGRNPKQGRHEKRRRVQGGLLVCIISANEHRQIMYVK